MVKAIIIAASFATGVLIGLTFAPAAHADPYAGPHCKPTASDYNSQMCVEEPSNDPACLAYGDRDQCASDWLDYQNQQHQLYTPTPN